MPPAPSTPPPILGALDYLLLRASPDAGVDGGVDGGVEALARFYVDLLGGAVIEEAYPHWARVRVADVDLGLHASDTLRAEAERSPSGVPAFRVADLSAWRDHLTAAGIEVGPDDQVEGGTVVTFHDPAGNALQLIRWGRAE